MADKKISELTELTTPDGTEELVVNDSGVSKKVQIDNLLAGGTISNFTSTGIDDNATSTAITIDASENVGVGTSSPVTLVEAWADTPEITITSNNPLSTSVGSENISSIGFRGQYNNLYRTSARIQARQNGTWSTVTSNIAPTAIDFFTQTSGTGDGMPTPKVSILADGGITFNGDTAAANALDDYEEGTWTPVLSDGTNNATMSSNNGGTYTKVGRTIILTGHMATNGLGSVTGNLRILGLPFTNAATIGHYASMVSAYGAGFAITAGVSVGGFVATNNAYISVTTMDSAAGSTFMQATEWQSSGTLMINLSYTI